MRNVIFIAILGVLAVVLFGVAWVSSSVLSTYVEQKNKEEHPAAADTGKEKELPPLAKNSEGGPRARTGSSNPETEQLVQEMAKLHEREEGVRRQEQQVIARRKALEIIKDDIKSEREEIDKLRKELGEQLKGAGDDLAAAEKRLKDLETKKDEEEKLLGDARKRVYEAESVRDGGVKRVGGIFDTAEPAEVAAIFERMVESGSDGLMTAAQILAKMKDRRAAAVLSAFQDKAMAADLAEKMVGLKQAPAAAPGGKAPRTPSDGSR
jgi:flagellar motility protein MotE (MotC chaperone)